MNHLCKTCQEHIENLADEQLDDFLEGLEKELYSDEEELEEDAQVVSEEDSCGQNLSSSSCVTRTSTRQD